MTAEQLAAGYRTYASSDELARAAASGSGATAENPTTSILTTVCITTHTQGFTAQT
jgi:hypothetical protein